MAEDEGEEGLTWQDILRMIGKILIIIAGGLSIAGACEKVAPEFGISAGVAKKLYNKHHKKVKK
jgi:hypothetical protein